MKLRLYYEERNFGPGVAGLMRLVRGRGSLAAVARRCIWPIQGLEDHTPRRGGPGISADGGRNAAKNGGATVPDRRAKRFKQGTCSL